MKHAMLVNKGHDKVKRTIEYWFNSIYMYFATLLRLDKIVRKACRKPMWSQTDVVAN